MYIGIDSRLIDLPLCCIFCSQIKTIRVLVANPECNDILSLKERQSALFSPQTTATAPSGLRIAQMRGQFSWPRTVRSTPRQIVAVGAHEKSRGSGDFVKSELCGLYIRRRLKQCLHFFAQRKFNYKF